MLPIWKAQVTAQLCLNRDSAGGWPGKLSQALGGSVVQTNLPKETFLSDVFFFFSLTMFSMHDMTSDSSSSVEKLVIPLG